MEFFVTGLVEVLFVIACLVVGVGLAIALFQAGFDGVQKRAYKNKKKWDREA